MAAVLLLAGCGSAVDAEPGRVPSSPTDVGAWSQLPPSPLSPRHEAACAFLDGRFYVIGGWSDPPCPPAASCVAPPEPAHRDGASFDPVSGSWQLLAPAPTPVSGVLEMTALDGQIYLLTGDVGRADSPVTFLSYDPDGDTWATLPPPPTVFPQLVAAGSKVVAISGSDGQGRSDDAVFDPGTRAWTTLPADPLGPSSVRSAAWLGDRLLLAGGDLAANGPSVTRLATLDAPLATWSRLPDSDIIGGYPVWVAQRVVFPMTGSEDGGEVGNWGRSYDNGGILDPATGNWTRLPSPLAGGSGLEGTIGSVGDRTLVGGQLLDPRSRAWTRVPAAPWGSAYRSGQTIITGSDSIFVWGGGTDRANLAEGHLLHLG